MFQKFNLFPGLRGVAAAAAQQEEESQADVVERRQRRLQLRPGLSSNFAAFDADLSFHRRHEKSSNEKSSTVVKSKNSSSR